MPSPSFLALEVLWNSRQHFLTLPYTCIAPGKQLVFFFASLGASPTQRQCTGGQVSSRDEASKEATSAARGTNLYARPVYAEQTSACVPVRVAVQASARVDASSCSQSPTEVAACMFSEGFAVANVVKRFVVPWPAS